MKAMHKEEKGFTLVELMVVVVIIAVLVAIAIPIYQGVQRTAAESAHDANVRTLKGAASVWFAEHGPVAVEHLPSGNTIGDDDGVLAFNGDFNQPDDTATDSPFTEEQANEANFGRYIDGDMPEVPGMVAGDMDFPYETTGDDDLTSPNYYVGITTDGQITVEPDIGDYGS